MVLLDDLNETQAMLRRWAPTLRPPARNFANSLALQIDAAKGGAEVRIWMRDQIEGLRRALATGT